jgi:hypothetical protein
MADTLATLIEEVQFELFQVVSPAVGQNYRDFIKARLRREYRRLYDDFNWPDLRVWQDKTLSAGENFYDLPTGWSLTNLTHIFYRWGSTWIPVPRGIDVTLYNAIDSDGGNRADPVQRWDWRNGQVEVWPIPATDATVMRLVGKQPFVQMVDEDDLCLIDADTVILFAAGELARRTNTEESALLLARAEGRYGAVRQRQQTGTNKLNFAAGAPKGYRHGFEDKTIIGVKGA